MTATMCTCGAGQRLMTPKDIADRSGYHPEVIRRAIRRGELQASKIGGRLRVRPAAYEAWLDRHQVNGSESR